MGTEVKYIITITNIVFAILFLVVLNQKIYAASNDLTFDQKFFAKDIAYTINAMYSIEGDVEAHYTISEALNVEIKNGWVIVSYKQAKESYPYIQDSKYNIGYTRDKFDLLIKKSITLDNIETADEEFIKNLKTGDEIKFEILNKVHTLKLIDLKTDKATIRIESKPISITLSELEMIALDLDNDGYMDISVQLSSINRERGIATIKITYLGKDKTNIFEYKFEKYPVIIETEKIEKELSQKPKEEKKEETEKVLEKEVEREEETPKKIVKLTEDLEYLTFSMPILRVTEDEKRYPVSEWAKNLPARKKMPIVEYRLSLKENKNTLGCGAHVLYSAFRDLGDEVNIKEIGDQKKGGFWRGFLSIFSGEAKKITWPSEIIKIAKGYGYEVEVLSGEDATKENILKKSTENSVVIIRGSLPSYVIPFIFHVQHYTIFDTNLYKSPSSIGEKYRKEFESLDSKHFEGMKINELYIITKAKKEVKK